MVSDARLKESIAAGSQLIMGPWTHGGLLNNSVGHATSGERSKFNLAAHILRFLAETLSKHEPVSGKPLLEVNGKGGPANGHGPANGNGPAHDTGMLYILPRCCD